jgi:hypothetical protein
LTEEEKPIKENDDQGDHESGVSFGEVIPEKNWQDSALAGVAALVLCVCLWVGVVWSRIQPPPEKERSQAEEAVSHPHSQPALEPFKIPSVPK